jgi:flagellar basal body-associated protein FliL
MSVESPSPHSDTEDSHRKVIETYRSISKWVVSSFGAVAGALVVGVQLSSLGKLQGAHLHWALLSVAVLFLAIIVVIIAAVRVLAPVRVTYRGLESAGEFKALQKAVKRDPTLLPENVTTLGGLVKNWQDAQIARNAAWDIRYTTPSDATMSKLAEEENITRAWYGRVMDTLWLGRALQTKRVFKQSMTITFLAILVAAAAATNFAYQSSTPTKETPKPPPKVQVTVSTPKVSVNEPKTCVDLYLALDELVRAKPNIGSHWPTTSLGKQDFACGFHNEKELAHFLSFLAQR